MWVVVGRRTLAPAHGGEASQFPGAANQRRSVPLVGGNEGYRTPDFPTGSGLVILHLWCILLTG